MRQGREDAVIVESGVKMNETSGARLAQAFRKGLMGSAAESTSQAQSKTGEPAQTPRKMKMGWFWLLGLFSVSVISFINQPSQEEVAKETAAGFHCLSKWDGSHDEVVRLVKQNLRDPSSFELIQTRVTPVNSDRRHGLRMEYRARNGFGGMTVETATATYRNDNCSVVSWSPN